MKMQPIWTPSVKKCYKTPNGQPGMNNTDKQVTFDTIKRTRMCNTNNISDEQHGIRQKYSTGICLYMKPNVSVKVNEFRNKKQFSYNLPLR